VEELLEVLTRLDVTLREQTSLAARAYEAHADAGTGLLLRTEGPACLAALLSQPAAAGVLAGAWAVLDCHLSGALSLGQLRTSAALAARAVAELEAHGVRGPLRRVGGALEAHAPHLARLFEARGGASRRLPPLAAYAAVYELCGSSGSGVPSAPASELTLLLLALLCAGARADDGCVSLVDTLRAALTGEPPWVTAVQLRRRAAAATRIQARVRGHLGRRRFAVLWADRAAEQEEGRQAADAARQAAAAAAETRAEELAEAEAEEALRLALEEQAAVQAEEAAAEAAAAEAQRASEAAESAACISQAAERRARDKAEAATQAALLARVEALDAAAAARAAAWDDDESGVTAITEAVPPAAQVMDDALPSAPLPALTQDPAAPSSAATIAVSSCAAATAAALRAASFAEEAQRSAAHTAAAARAAVVSQVSEALRSGGSVDPVLEPLVRQLRDAVASAVSSRAPSPAPLFCADAATQEALPPLANFAWPTLGEAEVYPSMAVQTQEHYVQALPPTAFGVAADMEALQHSLERMRPLTPPGPSDEVLTLASATWAQYEAVFGLACL